MFTYNVYASVFVALYIIVFSAGGAKAAPFDADDYALAPGDTVKFDVLDDDEDPVDLAIASNGSIQAPYLGAVHIAGLTLDEALDELSNRYVDRQIFVVPKLSLSIAAYRPIFVTGDVRQPGSYAFQPQITVEKAVALAGGQIAAAPTEDPVLARARVRGELNAIDTDITRQALSFARLSAQLSNRDEILSEDIPEVARPYVSGSVAESLRIIEERILDANIESFAARREVLRANLVEAEEEIALLAELSNKVETTVEVSRAALDRAKELQERGIQTLTEVSNLERQLAMEEVRQLQVLADLSAARRGVGSLKSNLTELEQLNKVNALVELQQQNAELAKSIAARNTAEEQLALLSSMTADELASSKNVTLEFTIRRQTPEGMEEISATSSTAVAPGDVVVARMVGDRAGSTIARLPPVGGTQLDNATTQAGRR